MLGLVKFLELLNGLVEVEKSEEEACEDEKLWVQPEHEGNGSGVIEVVIRSLLLHAHQLFDHE